MNRNIEGKVIVITDANSGLGEVAARQLSALGATLVLGSRYAARIDAIVRDIRSNSKNAIAVGVDVTKRYEVEELAKVAVANYGRIDVWVNNAGIMPTAPLSSLLVEEWDRMVDLNIKGVLYGIAAALPYMQRANSGHIIDIASAFGIRKFAPGGTVYCATKAAIRALYDGLRMEVHANKIRTTIISPGAVKSELKEAESTSNEQSSNVFKHLYGAMAVSAESIAWAIAYAIEQSPDIDINEIVVRPAEQAF